MPASRWAHRVAQVPVNEILNLLHFHSGYHQLACPITIDEPGASICQAPSFLCAGAARPEVVQPEYNQPIAARPLFGAREHRRRDSRARGFVLFRCG